MRRRKGKSVLTSQLILLILSFKSYCLLFKILSTKKLYFSSEEEVNKIKSLLLKEQPENKYRAKVNIRIFNYLRLFTHTFYNKIM